MNAAVPKPDYIFDRVDEWQALAEFATDDRLGATLGMVSGRRRQGKTLLLESMCEELGGLYFTVPEDMPESEHLRRLAEALAAFNGGLPPQLDSWDRAIEALFGLGVGDRPVLVVLDEFPYMARSAPGLPSIIQHALSPRGRARTGSRTRLILCGSSIAFMGQLVSGSAALFGRARFSLMVRAFDFRAAARFWGVSHDLQLATALFAMVGGTPAYIEYASSVPGSLAELDEWVTRNLLNSTNMLFRQPRMLLSEDSAFSQIGMYGTVLSALAEGSRTVSGIAQRVGRSTSDVNHYVKGLTDGGFLSHVPDAFRANRAEYQITDALIRFHHAIVYPNWSRLDLYRPERVARLWAESAETFRTQVMGPTFEDMCRVWTQEFASADTLAGQPDIVSHGVLNDPAGRSQRQLDVVVRDSRRGLVAIGEVKSGEVIGHGHLAKLREAVDLLRAQRHVDADAQPVLLFFSGAGFTLELAAEAAASGGAVQLIGPERLYYGS
jgi:hypothetical protein